MGNNEEMLKMIVNLTEENTRMKVALKYLYGEYKRLVEKDYSHEEIELALKLAGILDKEVNVIYFDNAEKEVAYEQKV